MSNGKGENTEKMDCIQDPSNTLPTILGEELIEEAKLSAETGDKLNEEAENKLNEEVGKVEGNKNNKRRRPSEKDR